jgi:hypothetical protein
MAHRVPRRYFAARKSLPKQYWTGAERSGAFSLYAFPDLSYLSQVASNDPYAHWWAPGGATPWHRLPAPRRRRAALAQRAAVQ